MTGWVLVSSMHSFTDARWIHPVVLSRYVRRVSVLIDGSVGLRAHGALGIGAVRLKTSKRKGLLEASFLFSASI